MVQWSRQEGSVYLLDQKVPVRYRWVRDRLRHAEVPLQTYERLREPYVKCGEDDSEAVCWFVWSIWFI